MDNPIVKVKLDHSIKINYVMCATGDRGTTVSTNGRALLTLGRLYEIPITLPAEDKLDNYNVIKLYGSAAETVSIKNIRDGIAVIQTLVHNTVIEDGDEFGYLL